MVRRKGVLQQTPYALLPMWHLAWAVAEWSARRNGIAVSATAVVIRTRPDAVRHWVSIRPPLIAM